VKFVVEVTVVPEVVGDDVPLTWEEFLGKEASFTIRTSLPDPACWKIKEFKRKRKRKRKGG
jgi:hypothetical protein